MKRILQACLYLLVFSCPLFSQEAYKFSTITTQDGLPDNRIYCSFMDSEGSIWFGTHDGLVRFFGSEFKLYLKGQIIKDIIEDKDKNLWIAAWGGGLHKLERNTEGIKSYRSETSMDNPIACNTLSCLLLGKDGTLWIGNGNCGLNFFDPKTEKFINYPLSKMPIKPEDTYFDNSVEDMLFDEDGRMIWLAAQNGIYKFDSEGRNIIRQDTHELGSRTPFLAIAKGSDSKPNILWTGTYGTGICSYNKLTGEIKSYVPDQAKWKRWDYNVIVDLFPKSSDELWFYSRDQELGIFNTKSNTFRFVELPKSNTPRDIGIDGFLNVDHQQRLWIGRTSSGIAVHDPNVELFDFIAIPQTSCNLQSSNRVTCFGENPSGDLLYVATAGCTGMHVFEKTGDSYRYLKTATIYDQEQRNAFTSIAVDKNGNVWLGAKTLPNPGDKKLKRPSLWQYFPETNLLKPAVLPLQDTFNLQQHTVTNLKADPDGRLWLAVNDGGLVEVSFQNNTKRLHKLSGVKSEFLDITDDEAGNLWVSTEKDGIYKFNKSTKKIERFHSSNGNGWYADLAATSLCSDGKIWLGTQGQYIIEFDPKLPSNQKMVALGEKEGLPFSKVTKVVKDIDGEMWVTTEQGLSQYDRANRRFINFNERDGLHSLFFYRLGLWVAKDGTLLIGQSNGFNYLPANRFKENQDIPKVEFTKIRVFEEERYISNGRNNTKEIHLKYNENYLSIGFSVIDYSHPDKNRYQYKIEELLEDWVELPDGKGQFSLTNLAPGDYIVQVKAANLQGAWSNPIQLNICILPPWWRTWWAKLAYLFIAASLAYFLWRFQLNRKLAIAEAQRLKDLDEVKSQLYANVTHEFRTPLTLIIGQAKRFLNTPNPVLGQEARSAFQSILQNGQRLLNLINQMLDVRKLEAGSLKPNWVKGDIVLFLRYLTESFSSMAQNRSIQLGFKCDLPRFEMDYDKDKLMKIMSNLLSNALKFTPKDGRVTVEVKEEKGLSGQSILVLVKDTGIGIPPTHLGQIFDRFFQIDNSSTRKGEGTGIGLSLTKELVELLDGQISVESIENIGTSFTVKLPIHRVATFLDSDGNEASIGGFSMPVIAPEGDVNAAVPVDNQDKPLILIVEDNHEVARFIASSLRRKYQVQFAENGQIGIERALELVPDLVISDVMMPEKDGFEVCAILKNDERTSHIPIIMLTAKAEVQDRLKGLRRGADAYLSKPFDEEELLVNIERSLKLRKVLQQRYAGLVLPLPTAALLPEETLAESFDVPIEDAFLQRVISEIKNNLADPNFGPAELCRKLTLSTSQMHRKLTAITDETPIDLIRKLRLKKAKQLLKIPGKRISEIAEEVGFSEPAYFTRVFTKEFGLSPSEFQRQ